MFLILFVFFTLLILLISVFRFNWKVVSLNFLNDFFHLDRVAHNCISSLFLLPLNFKHGILIKKREIFTLIVCNLFLKYMLKLLSGMRISLLLSSEELLISLLLLDLISPVIHPLHTIKMRLGYETCFDLNSFELLIMSFLL